MEKLYYQDFIIKIFIYASITCITMQRQLTSGNPYLKIIYNAREFASDLNRTAKSDSKREII